MRAKFLINTMLRAFVEQIQILVAQRRKESIRIVELADFPVFLFDTQAVRKCFGTIRDERLENPHRIDLFHGVTPLGTASVIHDFARDRILHERTDNDAIFSVVREGVHPQKFVGLRFLARASWRLTLAVSLGASAAIYLLFLKLGLPLPAGPLRFL